MHEQIRTEKMFLRKQIKIYDFNHYFALKNAQYHLIYIKLQVVVRLSYIKQDKTLQININEEMATFGYCL